MFNYIVHVYPLLFIHKYILDVGGWSQKNVLKNNLIWRQVSSTSTQVDSVRGIKLKRIEANETENFNGLGTINHNGSGYVIHPVPAVVPNNSTISELRDGDRYGNVHIVEHVENNGLAVKSVRHCVGDSKGKNRPPLNMIERPMETYIVPMSNGALPDCAVVKKETANIDSVRTGTNQLSMAKHKIPATVYKTDQSKSEMVKKSELDTGFENKEEHVVKNETNSCSEPDVCSKPDKCSTPDNCSKLDSCSTPDNCSMLNSCSTPDNCSKRDNCSTPDNCNKPVQSKIVVDQRSLRLKKFISNRQNICSSFLPKIDDLLFQPGIGSIVSHKNIFLHFKFSLTLALLDR